MPRTTLRERLQRVIAMRSIAASALSKKAGLAPGHVGLILSGNIKGNVQTDTLEALARAADVSYEWLATGRGEPELPSGPTIERDEADVPPPEDSSAAIDHALFRAMDPAKYEPEDFDQARAALRASYRKSIANADISTAVKRALDAAREARLSGEPVTTVAILSRIAFGRT